jgi:hypothetical protein
MSSVNKVEHLVWVLPCVGSYVTTSPSTIKKKAAYYEMLQRAPNLDGRYVIWGLVQVTKWILREFLVCWIPLTDFANTVRNIPQN